MNRNAEPIAIGIDLGGTFLRVAAVDSRGRVIARKRCNTPAGSPRADLLDAIARIARAVREEVGDRKGDPMPIGVAVPGTLDDARTRIVRSTSLPQLEQVEFVETLCDRLGASIVLLTDAEATTWGEHAARDPSPGRFVHLRLGTGVACGVVVDGKKLRLDRGRSTHLPELVVDRSEGALRCACGLTGCLETIASGAALQRRSAEAGFDDDLSSLQHAVDRGDTRAGAILDLDERGPLPYGHGSGGDTRAGAILDEAAGAILVAIERLTARFDPDVICLGGGAIEQLPALWSRVTDLAAHPSDRTSGDPPRSPDAKRRGIQPSPARTTRATLVEALRDDDAGVIGAALLARCDAPQDG